MHVMSKYLDTYKATLAALEDYASMQHILETTDQAIKDTYDRLTTVGSQRLDGMPHAPNPHAGEDRIASTLDRVDAYRERYAQAREYMDWFLPAWGVLSEDDRFVLDTFFFAADDISQEDRARAVADHFYVERETAFRRRTKAVHRLATALYG
ncbi:hypothetical protein NQ015_08170 [Corynebacterium sp. 153RC1]|uniref:Uncharacterized protein n=1 Tax=Trueperella pyogenes TaxID=1661 RepID=A0A3Q9GKV8_9ACTO|nr:MULTISPECIES: hypothetical protein [Actinomycetes]MDY5273428.1 hypothetical protein [Arcanobacterium sp.]ALD74534.1 hypothetical protein AN946_09750 [Trueperella pyogenes]AZR07265.1 hypothetical protein EBQ10_08150 [Trueperella pyogenes]MCQ9353000.1 hypothetical protein [Corynebacterium sp. 209RC1]MCQ9355162.1 hypothetical protein [Corynebacterium sp. 1222RC1]